MKKIVYTYLLALISSLSFSQVNDLDNQYTPPSNSVFNTDPNIKNLSNHNNGHSDLKNMIKFVPTMLFRQKAALFYEREIFKTVVVNVGVAKAFGEDVFQKTYLATFSSFNSTDLNLSPEEIYSNSTWKTTTPMFCAGVRAYLSDYNFEDSFVELYYRNEKTSYLLNDSYVTSINYISSDKTVNYKMHAIAFGYGYSSVFGPKNNFSHEMFVTFGIKFIYYDQIIKKQIYTNGYGPNQSYEKTGTTLTTRILPSVSIGYAFGFGF